MPEKLSKFTAYKFTRQLVFRYNEADLPAMSAQIAYYLILAFFPFLFFLMNLLSFTPLSNKLVIANLNVILPGDTAVLVKNILVQAGQAKSESFLFFGMLASLWAASRGISAIIRGLNNSYGVKESRKFVKLNFIALMSIVAFTAMIIFSFFLIVFERIIGSYIFGLIGQKALFYSFWPLARYSVSFTLMFSAFFLIYRYLPNRALQPKHIIVGTVFATSGWVAASLLFSYYVNNFAIYQKVYGSLGGLFALIVWLYISTLIFLLGGELIAISSNVERKKNKP